MCAVCFTAYDLVPAGAAWLRARWVRGSGSESDVTDIDETEVAETSTTKTPSDRDAPTSELLVDV